MGKKRTRVPETVFVQRVVDGDESYLVACDNVEEVDLDNGSTVYVYEYRRTISVSESPRTIEEV